ncbi:MAG: 1-acyl-sn-glycerol-3-phosphate acyltransferase [Nanoarchaeales archaeon]|nr:1-acyl-sn-glycerol-3-phosphate acyltransferase [Nanoarchaeales archaeon]
MKLKYLPIITTQLLFWVIGRFMFSFFYSTEHNFSKLKFDKDKKYIFISNHPSKSDPFLIGAYLPFSQIIKILPMRFMTTPKYMKKYHLTLFLKLFGCITTEKGTKYNVLDKSVKLLDDGNTIVIFPTGKLERNDKLRKPRVGAIYLHKKSYNSELVLFSIKIKEKIGLRNKLFLNLVGFETINVFNEVLEPIKDEIYNKIN